MQLKGMIGNCKKRKHIEILFYNEVKFLSDGRSAMCIERIAPDWGIRDIFTAMDLTEDAQEGFFTRNSETSENVNPDELVRLTRLMYSLNINGEPLQPFLFPDGRVIFVDLELMRVFRDEGNKEYFCKPNDVPLIFIRADGGLIGTVFPTQVNLESVRMFLGQLAKGVDAAAEAGFLDAGGQVEIAES
ncbi:MAG: hypothetical protein LUD03_06895 [Firmicutes bacterium]|nr:hypothetical protein [Bacillota bacterium]